MNHCKNVSVTISSTKDVAIAPELSIEGSVCSRRSSNSTSSCPIVEQDGGARVLPESFAPTESEVILGRGKQVTSHPGNMRYKEVVLSHIKEYSAAQTKALKSSILSQLVSNTRNSSAFLAGFVKQDSSTGRWTVAEDSAARIATAQIFRDALSDSYKSSKQFKQQRRQDRKGAAKKRHKESRENREQESLLDQHREMMQALSLPLPTTNSMANLLHPQPVPELQDNRLLGRLNIVLDQLRGGASHASLIPSDLMLPEQAKAEDTGFVSILADHFGSKIDPSSNPFEPTPILEDSSPFELDDLFLDMSELHTPFFHHQ
jgi:hypothetical protein